MPEGMGALNEKMGIELVEISAERVVGTMPVEGNTQPYGLLHGGASVVLAETLGSVGLGAARAGPTSSSVGVDINATHHRSATSGTVTGVATADPPRAQHGDLRDRHHRRARQAGLHLADHLRAAAARSASRPRLADRSALGPGAARAGAASGGRRAPGRAGGRGPALARALARARARPRTAWVVATRRTAARAEPEPGHEPVGVAGRSATAAVATWRDPALLGPASRRPPSARGRRRGGESGDSTCGETACTRGSRLSGVIGACAQVHGAGDLAVVLGDHDALRRRRPAPSAIAADIVDRLVRGSAATHDVGPQLGEVGRVVGVTARSDTRERFMRTILSPDLSTGLPRLVSPERDSR